MNIPITICKHCKTNPTKNKEAQFCGRTCAASFNNKNRSKTKPIKICACCSIPCNNKFCSNLCQRNFEKKKLIQQWLDGETTGLVGNYNIANFVRQYIIEIQENKCHYCHVLQSNWNKKPIVLQIDHVDGNYLNNRPENLRAVCPNCHALASTSGSKNKGKGRKQRKKYDDKKNSAIRGMAAN